MRPLVMKFGGTSVADAAAIRNVAAIVGRQAASGAPVVVVVSALAGVTNDLLRLSEIAPAGDLHEVERALAVIQRRHRTTIEELSIDNAAAFQDAGDAVTDECNQLRTVLESIAVLREATPRAVDRIAAAGELMSSRIVAAALVATGLRARWVDPRDIIVTDDAHPAIPQQPAIRGRVTAAVRPVLDRGEIAVTGGFVGATPAGITTTLGRGGSDYSASLAGSAIDAGEIQIWTDVDGMLTADPRVIPGARPVRRLTFDEAAELAYFGAKVLHPATILPAVERDIPVRILNTHRPGSEGSLITSRAREGHRSLTAIAAKRGITVIDVSVSMSVDDDRRLEAIEQDLRAFGEVRIDRRMAIVSAVGDALLGDATMAARVIGALDGVPLRMVSQAASRRNLTVVVDEADVARAMTRLYEEFFTAVEVAS